MSDHCPISPSQGSETVFRRRLCGSISLSYGFNVSITTVAAEAARSTPYDRSYGYKAIGVREMKSRSASPKTGLSEAALLESGLNEDLLSRVYALRCQTWRRMRILLIDGDTELESLSNEYWDSRAASPRMSVGRQSAWLEIMATVTSKQELA